MPVKRINLTKRLVDSLTGTGTELFFWDAELIGFGVRVTAAGVRSYVAKYRLAHGQSRRITIGRVGAVIHEEARTKARKILSEAKISKIDPVDREDREALTVGGLFQDWMASHVTRECSPNTSAGYRRVYAKHLAPRFGARPVLTVTHRQIDDMRAAMNSTPVAANAALRTLRACLKWGEKADRVKFPAGNPAERHKLYDETPVDRILSVPELRALIGSLLTTGPRPAVRRALMIQLLTAQRSGEVAGMRCDEIDTHERVWTIPAKRTKNGKSHDVPLTPMAWQIVSDAIAAAGRSPFVFPSTVAGQSFDAGTLSQAVERLRAKLGITEVFSPHDLRRTCSSRLEMIGHGEVARAAILNHTSQSVTGAHYSAGELSNLKWAALLDWEMALRQIMAGTDPFAQSARDRRAEEERRIAGVASPVSNVVPLARKA